MLFQFAQLVAKTLCKREAHALIAKAYVRVVKLHFGSTGARSPVLRTFRSASGCSGASSVSLMLRLTRFSAGLKSRFSL